MTLVESFKSFLASSLASTLLMNSFSKASLVMTPSGLAVNFFGSGAVRKKIVTDTFREEMLRSKNRKTKRMIKQPIEVQVAVSEHN